MIRNNPSQNAVLMMLVTIIGMLSKSVSQMSESREGKVISDIKLCTVEFS